MSEENDYIELSTFMAFLSVIYAEIEAIKIQFPKGTRDKINERVDRIIRNALTTMEERDPAEAARMAYLITQIQGQKLWEE